MAIIRRDVAALVSGTSGPSWRAFQMPDWYEDALCAQTDPEAFYPEKGGSPKDARVVCNACPVRAECLDYAMANGERFGIWGGTTERERRKIRKAGEAA